jgi:hypothetical protein
VFVELLKREVTVRRVRRVRYHRGKDEKRQGHRGRTDTSKERLQVTDHKVWGLGELLLGLLHMVPQRVLRMRFLEERAACQRPLG